MDLGSKTFFECGWAVQIVMIYHETAFNHEKSIQQNTIFLGNIPMESYNQIYAEART